MKELIHLWRQKPTLLSLHPKKRFTDISYSAQTWWYCGLQCYLAAKMSCIKTPCDTALFSINFWFVIETQYSSISKHLVTVARKKLALSR